jgi:phage gp29-like protein
MTTAHFSGLVDASGRPIPKPQKAVLTAEIAAATETGARSPLTGYPADELTPDRLAAILRAADAGEWLDWLELAEQMEERDPHYSGVLRTRKLSVSQLEITVDAGSPAPEHAAHAALVEEWLKRDELGSDLFDMLDAIGKARSFTEIIWEVSEGQWQPGRLERRDPRWFRFSRGDLTSPLLIGADGAETPLPGMKFIVADMKAKSGLPGRSGLARIAAWSYMFKRFTERDWAVFGQTFGVPLRIGRYGPDATPEQRRTLLRAVRDIAGDCAAIIPQSMSIEFEESKNVGASSDLFERRADWLDRQVSKAVLGQTATTDAISGGHAVGREHRLVQEDIERADARVLSAILNRDLVRPWIQLEFGPQKAYPRIRIGRAEEKDVKLIVDSVVKLLPHGLSAGRRQMARLIGLGEPEPGDEPLGAPQEPVRDAATASPVANDDEDVIGDDSGDKAADDAGIARPARMAREPAPALASAASSSPIGGAAEAAAGDWMALTGAMISSIEERLAAARTAEEVRAVFLEAAAAPPPSELTLRLGRAGFAAYLAGAADEDIA